MKDAPIQTAAKTDSHAVHACIMAAFAPFVASIEDFPDITHGLDDCIDSGNLFVAKANGTILGAMTVDVHEDFLKIDVLAVNPAYEGQGLGRRFMEFAESHTRSLDLSEMRLRTHVLMPQNVSLYEHLGWHVTTRDDHAVSMSRLL